MTSRRRRPTAVPVLSSLVLAAIVLAGWALHATGVLGAGDTVDALPGGSIGASPEPTTTVSGAPSTDPTPTGPDPATSNPTATVTTGAHADASADSARQLLATLPVKGKAAATGYDRVADFGTAWLDVDHNGCDTRNDVLARDLTHVVRRGQCTVLSGTLVSPYTGGTISFVRGQTTSTAVQIDHVVALENAWVTGAQQLSQDERQALANDPDNLFAVDQHSNAQKRSGDAATWLPASKAFRCTYVEHQVTVKARYHLWVAPAERDAVERVLATC